jgi:putative transposase
MAEPSVDQRRAIVKALAQKHGGVAAMCRLLDLSESSYYHTGPGYWDVEADLELLGALVKLSGRYPTYGYRRLTKLVRKRKAFSHVNAKRVRRLLTNAGMTAKKRSRKVATTDSRHGFERYPNLVNDWQLAKAPDDIWVVDITYIVLATGEICYLAVVMDVFTRTIRGWALGTECNHQLCLLALRRALKHGTCKIHHSDQGVQYATPKYTQALKDHGVQISMAAVGKAWENGMCERFMRTIKEEEVYLTEYEMFEDALKNIGRFIDIVYNTKRMHSSLGDLSPAEFEAIWRARH